MPGMSAEPKKRGQHRNSRRRSGQGSTSRDSEPSRRPITPRDNVSTDRTGRPLTDYSRNGFSSPTASGAYTTRPLPDHNRGRSCSSNESEEPIAPQAFGSLNSRLPRPVAAETGVPRSQATPSGLSNAPRPAAQVTQASPQADVPRYNVSPRMPRRSVSFAEAVQGRPEQPLETPGPVPGASSNSTPGSSNPHRPPSGSSQQLSAGYNPRPKKFFKFGRVFQVLWTESGSPTAKTAVTESRQHIWIQDGIFGESFFAKFRWFIVIREGRNSCGCVPIVTYDGRGIAKPSVIKSEHAIVYIGSKVPDLFPDELPVGLEQGPRTPIQILPDIITDVLKPRSRVDYGRTYTVEHNVKAKNFGLVDPRSLPFLHADYCSVFHDTAAAALQSRVKRQVDTSREADLRSSSRDIANSATNPTSGKGKAPLRSSVAVPNVGKAATTNQSQVFGSMPLSLGRKSDGPESTSLPILSKDVPLQQSASRTADVATPSIPEINAAANQILSPYFQNSREAALAIRNAVFDRQLAHRQAQTGVPQSSGLAYEAAVSAIMAQGWSRDQAKAELSSVVQAKRTQASRIPATPMTGVNQVRTAQVFSDIAANPNNQMASSMNQNRAYAQLPGALGPRSIQPQDPPQPADEDEESSEESSSGEEEDEAATTQQPMPMRRAGPQPR